MTIPTVDMNEYDTYNDRFVHDLGNAFKDIGFVAIKNHGIRQETIHGLYKNVKTFFDLPTENKKEYEVISMAGQRGYTSQGRERAHGSNCADLKEFFQYGKDGNIVPTEVDGFEATLDQAFKEFEATGMKLLQSIALYLGLPQHHFCDMAIKGDSIIRCIHYPPIDQTCDPVAVRATAHEDINMITLLVGASSDGLQVQLRDGSWISVDHQNDTIVVNIGDMMQSLTDGVMKSTTHRVVNPVSELRGTSRYSIPFFLHPRGDVCISKETGKSAREFLEQRLREIGLLRIN